MSAILALLMGVTAARAQTALPEAGSGAAGPLVVSPSGAVAPASPSIEYAPVPAEAPPAPKALAPEPLAPEPRAPEPLAPKPLAPEPLAPTPLARKPLPPGSATDANRFDAPATTLKKAGEVVEDLASGNVKALRRGPLLLHGNYCGIGNKPGLPPVDVLDAACMRHDACTRTGALPNCACNDRLRREATAIAEDPSRTEELRALAGATAASMAVLICK